MGNFSPGWPHPCETWSHSWWCLIYLQWQTAWDGHFITLCGGPWATDYSWETFWLNPQQFLNCRVIFLWVPTFYRSSHFPSVTKTSQQRDVRSLFFKKKSNQATLQGGELYWYTINWTQLTARVWNDSLPLGTKVRLSWTCIDANRRYPFAERNSLQHFLAFVPQTQIIIIMNCACNPLWGG